MSSLTQVSRSASVYRLEEAKPVIRTVAEHPLELAELEPILVVVPCFNEENHVEKVVRQILEQEGAERITIVVVDGASTDRTAEIAKGLAEKHDNVRYLFNPGRLQSIAVNMAVREYGEGYRYIARLDAHASYPRDFCINLIREAMATAADSVVVSMRTEGRNFVQEAAAAAQNSRLGNGGSAHRKPQASGRWVDHGHHALIRIAAFQALGGYDERFSHNEDAEFDMRLAKAGFRCWLTNKTQLVYFPRTTIKGIYTQYFNYGRGRARTFLKHKQVPKLRQMLPLGVMPAVVLALAAPILPLAAAPALAWIVLCLAYGVGIGVRRRNVAAMASGPIALLIHFAWSYGFWDLLLRSLFGGKR